MARATVDSLFADMKVNAGKTEEKSATIKNETVKPASEKVEEEKPQEQAIEDEGILAKEAEEENISSKTASNAENTKPIPNDINRVDFNGNAAETLNTIQNPVNQQQPNQIPELAINGSFLHYEAPKVKHNHTFYISDENYAQLKALADNYRMSISVVLDDILSKIF